MQLRRILYYSRNRLDPAAGPIDAQVRDILSVSVANNNKAKITGALIYDSNWFAQVLEGDVEAVAAVFAKIKADPRHGDVVVAESGPVKERRFPYWWMALASWDDVRAIKQGLAVGETFDPGSIPPEHLVALMESVIHMQVRRPIRGKLGAMERA